MGSSQVIADAILNLLNNIQTTIGRDGAYISLHSADPGATGANEVSGGGYVRQLIDAANWNVPTGVIGTNRHIPNQTLVAYAEATADYAGGANITHLGLWIHVSASTASDFWAGGAVTTPKPVLNTQTARWPVGAARWQVD